MSGPLRPIPGLQGLQAYAVPRHPAPIDLPLHGNEGPAPPAALLARLAEASPELLRRYPTAAPVEAKLATRLGVEPRQVLVTAGGDEALERAFRAFLAPGDALILPTPTFVMLPHYARLVSARVHSPSWPAEDFPEAEVLAAIGPETRAVALVSPNNPTGAVIAPEVISRIAEAAPQAAILVDFAYVETADADPTRALLRHPNVLIFRTLSKVWGLAGARVGYVVGAPETLAWLRAAGSPFPCSALSLAVADHQLSHGEAAMQAYVAAVRAEREALFDVLARCGTRPVRSQGNFIFARCGSTARAVWLRDGLAGLGVGVRAFPGEAEISDGVRITCPGDARDLRRLTAAIEAVLRPVRRVEDLSRAEDLEGGLAWALARTPDEVRRARAAGVVPLGAGAPGTAEAEALLTAGAARVVRSFEALEEEIA